MRPKQDHAKKVARSSMTASVKRRPPKNTRMRLDLLLQGLRAPTVKPKTSPHVQTQKMSRQR
jgi:hypothetical protein